MAPRGSTGAGMVITAMRFIQAGCLISMIGLTSNFVSEMVSERYPVPSALIGSFIVTCLSTLYAGISFYLFWKNKLTFSIAALAEFMCFAGATFSGCFVVKPTTGLNCHQFPRRGKGADFVSSLYINVEQPRVVDPDRATCVEIQALCALLTVTAATFIVSGLAAVKLCRRVQRNRISESNNRNNRNYNNNNNITSDDAETASKTEEHPPAVGQQTEMAKAG